MRSRTGPKLWRWPRQLAISPQCGFSSAAGVNDATGVQWRKIDVMCRAADRVRGRR